MQPGTDVSSSIMLLLEFCSFSFEKLKQLRSICLVMSRMLRNHQSDISSSLEFSQGSTDLLNNKSIVGIVIEDDYGAGLFEFEIGAPRISMITEDDNLVLISIDILKIFHPRSRRNRRVVKEIVSLEQLEPVITLEPLLVIISSPLDGKMTDPC